MNSVSRVSGDHQIVGERAIRKLLVVVDGSKAANDALEYAIVMASGLGCELAVAFIIDTASMDILLQMNIFVSEERDDFEQELEHKGRRTLEAVRERCRQAGLRVETFLMKGCVHQVVLLAARKLSADTIVIGGWHNTSTRKDTTSVERQLILDQADCPVIVVKHQN